MMSAINLLSAFIAAHVANDEENACNNDFQTLSILVSLVSVCIAAVERGTARTMSQEAPETFAGKPSLANTISFYPFSI